MTTLSWDVVGERLYETGVDRGVIYPKDEAGIVWNGLVSAEASAEGRDVTPIYFNGVKIFDYQIPGDFSGNITAITYPDRLNELTGVGDFGAGGYVDNQSPKRFGMSWRTLIGSDTDPLGFRYKLHILYNVLATPEDISYETMSDDTTPAEFEWSLTCTPVRPQGRRPSAHFEFDSGVVEPTVLAAIEEMLYGTDLASPYLPTVEELLASIGIVITDNGDGTWTATGPDHLFTIVGDVFTIDEANAIYLDADTYRLSST